MKRKYWIGYAIYALILLFAFIFCNYILTYLKELMNKTFQPEPSFTLTIAVYVMLGILLGLEHLFMERKKEGKWRINLPKLLLLGIPSLTCVFPVIFYPLIHTLVSNEALLSLVQVIFGYALSSSFYKSPPKPLPVLENAQEQS